MRRAKKKGLVITAAEKDYGVGCRPLDMDNLSVMNQFVFDGLDKPRA